MMRSVPIHWPPNPDEPIVPRALCWHMDAYAISGVAPFATDRPRDWWLRLDGMPLVLATMRLGGYACMSAIAHAWKGSEGAVRFIEVPADYIRAALPIPGAKCLRAAATTFLNRTGDTYPELQFALAWELTREGRRLAYKR